jgi:hypothetical protein
MQVFDFATIKSSMGTTKTYEDFHKFLGAKPHRLGIVSRQYTDLTASYLTESLMNIYTNESKASKFQSIDALVFEWEVDVEFIKRVEFASLPIGDGSNGSDIVMAFRERYYEKYDTFRIEGSRQLCIVKVAPIRKADNHWEVVVQLIDADFSSILDATQCQVGMQTRFITNYHPEMSEEGYTKYQSNIERYRNHISFHRNDITYSSQFAALEDVFIKLGQNAGSGDKAQVIYKMKKKEQELLENFLFARNNALLFGKSNFDKNGKCTVTDPHTGRQIPMGDGIIAQIERYANKYAYAKMSTNVMDTVLEYMRQKSRKSDGNQYVFIVNERMWTQIQKSLREYLKQWQPTNPVFFSQKAGQNVTVGATFESYIMGGNQISFKVDKALTLEYSNKGYGICIDLTADLTSGQPAMQMFTLKGGEFIRGFQKGLGGLTGLESGEISTPVAASRLVHAGYAGVGVFSPYRSFVIEENI